MAFHVSNLGMFGGTRHADMNGYVPEAGDGPWDLDYDHGGRATHDAAGELTEYGEWWEEDGYPELLAAAIEATAASNDAAREWQDAN